MPRDHLAEPELERQAHRLMKPSGPFLLIAAALGIAGIILLVVGSGSWWVLGVVLLALAGPPAAVAFGLLGAGGVSRWAARHKPFA